MTVAIRVVSAGLVYVEQLIAIVPCEYQHRINGTWKIVISPTRRSPLGDVCMLAFLRSLAGEA